MSNVNQSFTTYTTATKEIKVGRANAVKVLIKEIRDEAKLLVTNSNSMKDNIKAVSKSLLNGDKGDNYFKRTVVVAVEIMVRKLDVKVNELTLAELEKLISFSNVKINKLYKSTTYVADCKKLFKETTIVRTVNIFSKELASSK